MTHRFTRRAGRVASTVVLAAVLSACGTTNTNYVTGESQRGAYTWAQERQIGAEADQQIVAQFGVYDDAELSAYVNGIAQSTLQTSAYSAPTTPAEIRNSPFTFRVLDSPVVNAFALPGGYVYLTRGLLAFLENEAQLSVVLGHEIGHVLARHSSAQAQRAQLGQLGVVGAAILGGVIGNGRIAEGIAQYGGAGAQLLLLRYGRDAEREADQAGVAYAEFAGYDAAQASRFFR
ncbi:MAG TPA: M48 family metalloprotease, partial [Rubricoccaceae bacterium]